MPLFTLIEPTYLSSHEMGNARTGSDENARSDNSLAESLHPDVRRTSRMQSQAVDWFQSSPGPRPRRAPDWLRDQYRNDALADPSQQRSRIESNRGTTEPSETEKQSSPEYTEATKPGKRKDATGGGNASSAPGRKGGPKAKDLYPKGYLAVLPRTVSHARVHRQCSDYRVALREKNRQLREKDEQIHKARQYKNEYHRNVIAMQEDIRSAATINQVVKTDDGMVREKLEEIEEMNKELAKQSAFQGILADVLSEDGKIAMFQLFTDREAGSTCRAITTVGQQEVLQAPRGAYLLLHAFIAHYVYHNIFEYPFFMLYEHGVSADGPGQASSLSAMYKHILSSDPDSAEQWLAMTLKHLIPNVDGTNASFGGNSEDTFDSRKEKYYSHKAAQFVFSKPVRSIMLHHSSDDEIRRFFGELKEILRKAGEVACQLRCQKTAIKCMGCHGKEIQRQSFFTPKYRKIHGLMRLSPDDKSLDGVLMNLVVTPAILALDLDRKDNSADYKVLKKALVWKAPLVSPCMNAKSSTPDVALSATKDKLPTLNMKVVESTVIESLKAEAEEPQKSKDHVFKQETKDGVVIFATAQDQASRSQPQRYATLQETKFGTDDQSTDVKGVKRSHSPEPGVSQDASKSSTAEIDANRAVGAELDPIRSASASKRPASVMQGRDQRDITQRHSKRLKQEPANDVPVEAGKCKLRKGANSKKATTRPFMYHSSSDDEDEIQPQCDGAEGKAARPGASIKTIAEPEKTREPSQTQNPHRPPEKAAELEQKTEKETGSQREETKSEGPGGLVAGGKPHPPAESAGKPQTATSQVGEESLVEGTSKQPIENPVGGLDSRDLSQEQGNRAQFTGIVIDLSD